MNSPKMVRGQNFDSVRLERDGFVFIARLLPRYKHLPGFRSLEIYETAGGKERFRRHATPAEIVDLFPSLANMVKVAIEDESLKTRAQQSHYCTRGGTRVDSNGCLVSTGVYSSRPGKVG